MNLTQFGLALQSNSSFNTLLVYKLSEKTIVCNHIRYHALISFFGCLRKLHYVFHKTLGHKLYTRAVQKTKQPNPSDWPEKQGRF